MGFRYDPDTGRELRDFDQKTAEEYYKQQGLAPQKQGVSAAGGLRGLLARLRRSVSPQGETASAEQTDTPTVVAGQNPFESDLSSTSNLWLRVEKVQVGPDRTILHLASRAPESEEGMLVAAVQEQTYLVDENGQTYMLQADSGNYPRKSYRTILRDETYRFTMTFPALRPGIKRLKFYRSRFSPIVLDELLAQAERLPEVRQASGVRQAVEVNVTPAPASPAPFVTPPAEVRESEPGLAHIKAEEPGPKRPAARYFQLGLGMGPIRSHGIPGYDLWIQRMQLEPGATILHFVASGISGDSGLLNPATSPPGSLPHCYLTDDQGPALRALGRRGGV